MRIYNIRFLDNTSKLIPYLYWYMKMVFTSDLNPPPKSRSIMGYQSQYDTLQNNHPTNIYIFTIKTSMLIFT